LLECQSNRFQMVIVVSEAYLSREIALYSTIPKVAALSIAGTS
jgi:hypothetical protein